MASQLIDVDVVLSAVVTFSSPKLSLRRCGFGKSNVGKGGEVLRPDCDLCSWVGRISLWSRARATGRVSKREREREEGAGSEPARCSPQMCAPSDHPLAEM
eukprot:6172451-Pleurochrysis_carterae.AAC.1